VQEGGRLRRRGSEAGRERGERGRERGDVGVVGERGRPLRGQQGLGQRPERKDRRGVDGASEQGRRTPPRAPAVHLPQEPGLPDARLAGDEHDRSAACRGVVDRAPQHRQLGRPADYRRREQGRVHDRKHADG
jgi:hypothetical protein